MAKQSQKCGTKMTDLDGKDITSQVKRIKFGNLNKIVGVLDDQEVMTLRGGLHLQKRIDRSSKVIDLTGNGADISRISSDRDF